MKCREELRELIQYLESKSKEIFYSDLQDEDIISILNEPTISSNYGNAYRRRVESFIRENKHYSNHI